MDWLTILVSLGSILGGGYWIVTRLFRFFFNSDGREVDSFKSLRKAIRPLMEDSSRIFFQFGPNSGANSIEPVRFDLSVWKRARVGIGDNNRKIAKLIRDHQALIPLERERIFNDWLSHIDAFAAHLEDETVDYRDYQFPAGIPDIIRHG